MRSVTSTIFLIHMNKIFFLISCKSQDGEYKINYYIFPFKESEGHIRNNLKEGTWKYYDPDGTIKSIITYSKGIEDGHYQAYYENGKLSSDAYIKNGNFVGFVRNYYQSGNINSEEYYDEHSLMQGKFRLWFESGKLMQVGIRLNGKIIGDCILYYENGKIKENRFYDSLGNRDSIWKSYSIKGDLIKEEKYKADSLILEEVK